MQHFTVAVYVTDKRDDTAFKEESDLFFRRAFINQFDQHITRDKSHFPEALHQRIKFIIHIPFEDLAIELICGGCTRF